MSWLNLAISTSQYVWLDASTIVNSAHPVSHGVVDRPHVYSVVAQSCWLTGAGFGYGLLLRVKRPASP